MSKNNVKFKILVDGHIHNGKLVKKNSEILVSDNIAKILENKGIGIIVNQNKEVKDTQNKAILNTNKSDTVATKAIIK